MLKGAKIMKITSDREERREQKEVLRSLYPDYNPKYHDMFVIRFNKEQDKNNLHNYMVNRQLITS
jgi:hypothetical protein